MDLPILSASIFILVRTRLPRRAFRSPLARILILERVQQVWIPEKGSGPLPPWTLKPELIRLFIT